MNSLHLFTVQIISISAMLMVIPIYSNAETIHPNTKLIHSNADNKQISTTSVNTPVSLNSDIKILFLGDSLTEGFGVEPEEAFPTLIDKTLKQKGYKNITVINAGISGSTTASAVSRLKWYATMQSDIKPNILFLALGANDGLRGLSLKAMEQNLNSAIEIVLNSKMKIILAGMEIPPNYGVKYTSDFRNVFKSLAEKHKITFMPYLLKDVGGFEKLNQPDGVHPNADGYKVVAKNVIPYILEKL